MTRIYLSKDGVVRTPDAGEHSHHSMAKTILGPGWCGDVEDAYAAMWQAGWVRVVETVDKVNGERYLNGQPVPFNELTPEQRGWFEGKRALEGKLFIWNDQEFASTREARPGDGKTRNYPFHYEAQFAALLGTYSELLENKQTGPEGTMDEYEAKLKTLSYDELLDRWLAACPDYEYARTAFDCMPADEQLRRLIGLADGHLRAETHWPLLGKFITALRYRRRHDTVDFAAAGEAIITAYNQRLTKEQRERVKTHVAGEVDFGSVVQGERREPWFIEQFSPIGGYYSQWMLHVLGSTLGMVCNTLHPTMVENAWVLNQMLGGAPARFVWLFLDFREDPRKYWDPDHDDHVIDQLGACYHAVSDPIYFIVLHMRGIAKAAEDLGHPEQAHDLGMLVFLHELAHGVHLGLRDLDGVRNPAAPKPLSRPDWIELVAQLLTWHTIKDDPKLAALFEAWTDISPPEYQRWRTMRDCSMEDFRAYLWFLRRNGAAKNGLDFQDWFCAEYPQMPPIPITPSGEQMLAFDHILKVCALSCAPPNDYQVNLQSSSNIVSDLAEGGADILGCYDCESGSVTLYTKKCRQAAEVLGFSPGDVEMIVLIHEWSHLVHHRGTLESSGNHWSDFPRMWQFADTDVEDLAEKTTFLVLHEIGDSEHLRAIQIKMAKMSPSVYRKWISNYGAWLNSGVVPENSVEDLRCKLRRTRKTEPGDVLRDPFDS